MTASLHRLLAIVVFIAPLTAACTPNDSYELVHQQASDDGSAVVEIYAASPRGFAPHPVQVFLTVSGTRLLAIEDRLSNDGARISADNFPMAFGSSGVSVCFRGDEQDDVLYRIPFNRGPHQMSRNSCLPPVPVPNSPLERQPTSNR